MESFCKKCKMTLVMLEKQILQNLYSEGLSMSDIANRLGVSANQVVYWMEKFGLDRRSRSEALYVKNNPDGDPFKIKMELNDYDKFLLGLGLGIFWGEGMKMSKSGVRVGNTDPFCFFILESFWREYVE